MGLEARFSQGQLHDFRGPGQNENGGPFVPNSGRKPPSPPVCPSACPALPRLCLQGQSLGRAPHGGIGPASNSAQRLPQGRGAPQHLRLQAPAHPPTPHSTSLTKHKPKGKILKLQVTSGMAPLGSAGPVPLQRSPEAGLSGPGPTAGQPADGLGAGVNVLLPQQQFPVWMCTLPWM